MAKKIFLFHKVCDALYFEGRVNSILETRPYRLKCFDDWHGNIVDAVGNVVMSADDYEEAARTGIGILNFDNDFDSWYTTFSDDLTDKETAAVIDSF